MKFENDSYNHYANLDFSEGFLSDSDPGLSIELPYPIHNPLEELKIDKIAKFNEDLESYNNRLAKLSKEFQLVKNRIINQTFSNSHAVITRDLLNFCNSEKIEAPFPCDFNPYYCTGSLEHFVLAGKDYLVRSDVHHNICVTNILYPRKVYKLQIEESFNENITGISGYDANGTIFLLLKHINEANLLKLTDIKETVEIPFTKKFKRSILDAKIHDTKVGFVLSNSKFQLYDIETNCRIDLKPCDVKGVHHCEFTDINTVVMVAQDVIKLVDLRSNNHNLFSPQKDKCNFLCTVKCYDNVMYVASRHHLLRADVRFFKNVEYCTHLMKCSPTYMEIADNFLCLSSQREDKVLFSGRPTSSLPLNVPSICDTLNEYRLHKDVLLRDDVSKRAQKSIGGIKFINCDNDVYLYSTNYLGDIFKQKISNNPTEIDLPLDCFSKWVNSLPRDSSHLHLTNTVNMSDTRFALNKKIEEKELKRFFKKSNNGNKFLNQFKNRYHRNNIGELAANFASIWDEDEEEDREVDLVPEVAPLDKVSNWIESSSYYFD